MLKNKPIYIFLIILIAIISIAISVVVSVYNKNKPIVPDNSISVTNNMDAFKIKQAYDSQEKKEQFINTCKSIELAVANNLLDGTVTNEQELETAITKINKILSSSDWSSLGITKDNYWMGNWSLDKKGAVKFSFKSEDIAPDWIKDNEVKGYIK